MFHLVVQDRSHRKNTVRVELYQRVLEVITQTQSLLRRLFDAIASKHRGLLSVGDQVPLRIAPETWMFGCEKESLLPGAGRVWQQGRT